MADNARRADEAGVAFTSVGDNPSALRDSVVALTVMAEATDRCRLGPTVMNPSRRDPLVVATSMSSIDALSGGRAFLTMATGRAEQNSLARLESFVGAVKQLWSDGHASYEGREFELHWDAKPVPVLVAGNGPATLRLAGRIADGVIVEAGVSPEVISWANDRIAEGAAEAGRDASELEVWWYVRASLDESYSAGVDSMRAALAAAGAHVLRGDLDAKLVPSEYQAHARRLLEGYDFKAHLNTGPNNPNAALITDEGFLEHLSQRFALTGTPTDWYARLEGLAELGATRFFIAAVVPDYPDFVSTLCAEVMPGLAGIQTSRQRGVGSN